MLLDDPLSAVDMKVGAYIFDRFVFDLEISNHLLLGKIHTYILSTAR